MFLVFLSFVCLILAYLRPNPISSGLSVILALLFITPLISLMSLAIFGFLLVLLFVSGILTLLVYFASLSRFSFKGVLYWPLLPLCFFISCGSLGRGVFGRNLGSLYFSVIWLYIFLILLFLIALILVVSYFLSSEGRLRSF